MNLAARRYRLLAIQLGGVLIKVGQFLSTRADVLPPEITAELAGLQDEVPPVPFDQIEVFESNFPVEKASNTYVNLWNAFKRITENYSAGERAGLFHDNAVRVYRIA